MRRNEPPVVERGNREKLVRDWNAANRIGTEVDVVRDDGSVTRTATTSNALVLNTTPVIWLRDISGCYDLRRVAAVKLEEVNQ